MIYQTYKFEKKINDNGLVALALLVAQSNTDDKELMVQFLNLINTKQTKAS